jgi:hypothetical protein
MARLISENRMRVGTIMVSLLLAAGLSGTQRAFAEDAPADLTAFHATCRTAEAFLLGDIPDGIDVPKVLDALCSCLGTQFKDLPQGDIDVLEADLGMRSTVETHVAYGDYEALKQRGGLAMGTCFASPEVTALLP